MPITKNIDFQHAICTKTIFFLHESLFKFRSAQLWFVSQLNVVLHPILDVMEDFLNSKLQRQATEMEEILAHGTPRNLENSYQVNAPYAIVVMFVRIEDRNLVPQQCRKVRMPKETADRPVKEGSHKKGLPTFSKQNLKTCIMERWSKFVKTQEKMGKISRLRVDILFQVDC